MQMSKEQFQKLLKNFRWSSIFSTADASDIEDILNFVHDLFVEEAEAIRENCPYATRSLADCETITRTLSFSSSDIIELFEEAQEA